MKKIVTLFALAALALAACGGSGASDDPGRLAANLRITVVAAPVCPVATNPPDPACAPRPVAEAHLMISGVAANELVSGIDGLVAARLAPGDYLLTPAANAGYPGLPEPQDFTVTEDGLVELLVVYDTGIR